ncbi:uncharacterized protein FFB20_11850 [Fusarium fujikuroi]|nr:uncharacterized protein FFE2_05271 [Fusarium fujikuroi]SCN83943.1 uncharacterized protein FFC1_04374 [Fusarium fujikuroi]SCO03078.1 uncharacterized protein FFB20_11850 [Fusarium fujikuroi]SCO34937.1 uncharacterized protein FFNC_04128 [Fusarium fujikuroi]SCV36244.1 uncharacterized protein FFFS_05086 [Fusarium fujikuroi]
MAWKTSDRGLCKHVTFPGIRGRYPPWMGWRLAQYYITKSVHNGPFLTSYAMQREGAQQQTHIRITARAAWSIKGNTHSLGPYKSGVGPEEVCSEEATIFGVVTTNR